MLCSLYEWVSDCRFTPREQLYSYIMTRTISISMRWWCCLLCTRPRRLYSFSSYTKALCSIPVGGVSELTTKWANFRYIMPRRNTVRWEYDYVRFVLDQRMHLYNASSLKQQFTGRHVAPHGQTILIPIQPDYAFTPYCLVLRGETANTNFIVFGFTRQRERGHYVPHSKRARSMQSIFLFKFWDKLYTFGHFCYIVW